MLRFTRYIILVQEGAHQGYFCTAIKGFLPLKEWKRLGFGTS